MYFYIYKSTTVAVSLHIYLHTGIYAHVHIVLVTDLGYLL